MKHIYFFVAGIVLGLALLYGHNAGAQVTYPTNGVALEIGYYWPITDTRVQAYQLVNPTAVTTTVDGSIMSNPNDWIVMTNGGATTQRLDDTTFRGTYTSHLPGDAGCN